MRYTIHLFEVDEDSLDLVAGADPSLLVERVRARIKTNRRLSNAEKTRGITLLEEILSGTISQRGSIDDYYWAYVWLAETVLTRIDLTCLTQLTSESYLSQSGILQVLSRETPIPLPPKAEGLSPGAGIIPINQMDGVRSKLLSLPEPADSYASEMRIQFCDVLESCVEDQVFLLAITTRS